MSASGSVGTIVVDVETTGDIDFRALNRRGVSGRERRDAIQRLSLRVACVYLSETDT